MTAETASAMDRLPSSSTRDEFGLVAIQNVLNVNNVLLPRTESGHIASGRRHGLQYTFFSIVMTGHRDADHSKLYNTYRNTDIRYRSFNDTYHDTAGNILMSYCTKKNI